MSTAAAARRTSPWEQISYDVPVPADFLIPEHHWPTLEKAPLERDVRVRANQLAVRFSCEMFVHFERYVIDYLEQYPHRFEGLLSKPLVDRFVEEERVHVDAFYRLLALLRPDLHANRTLRFLRWTKWDRLMLRVSPAVTFFMIAAMFEEMTLFVPVVMDEKKSESFGPVHEVMHLHAREERGHVSLDEKALTGSLQRVPRWRFALQVLWTLPLMLYVDTLLARTWKRSMSEFARQEGLSPAQTKALLARKPSRSDVLGIRSFIEKQRALNYPGGRTLCAILETLLR